jgi:hypothetical protein
MNNENLNLYYTKKRIESSIKKDDTNTIDNNIEDNIHKSLYDIINSDMNKSLFLCLVELLAQTVGDDFRKLCSRLDIRYTQIGSLSIITGNKVYALSFILVDPIYRNNLNETRNNLSSEADKFQFTSIIVKITEILNLYYSSLQYFYPNIFETYKTRLKTNDFTLLKKDKYDNFYLTESGKRLGYLITEMKKESTNDLIRTAVNANELL